MLKYWHWLSIYRHFLKYWWNINTSFENIYKKILKRYCMILDLAYGTPLLWREGPLTNSKTCNLNLLHLGISSSKCEARFIYAKKVGHDYLIDTGVINLKSKEACTSNLHIIVYCLVFFLLLFSCPELLQVNRWPCHRVTH